MLDEADLDRMIDALKPEFAAARAAGDAAAQARIQAEYATLKDLRRLARLAAMEGREAEFAAALRARAREVERIAERLEDVETLLALGTDPGAPPEGPEPETVAPETFAPGEGEGDGADLSAMLAAAGLPEAPIAPTLDAPGPAPSGGPSRFVAARQLAPRTLRFTDEAGRDFLRIGGSRAWRNFNPGNIRKGDFAIANGAIGDDGAFAAFPDEATGRAAIATLLRGPSYRDLSIRDGIFRYAPPSENDSEAYARFIADRTGLDTSRRLGELRAAEVRKVVDAIRTLEGWTPGEMHADAPASGGEAGASAGLSSASGAAAEWMDVARREAALPPEARSEWSGPGRHNPRILDYFRVGAGFTQRSDEVHWCAAFVNYCLVTSGHVGTGHPGARSFFWNAKRQFSVLPGPRADCIGVLRYAPFDDPEWATGSGHVGFVVDFDATHVTLLGGNQGDTVSERRYARERRRAGVVSSRFVAFLMPVMN